MWTKSKPILYFQAPTFGIHIEYWFRKDSLKFQSTLELRLLTRYILPMFYVIHTRIYIYIIVRTIMYFNNIKHIAKIFVLDLWFNYIGKVEMYDCAECVCTIRTLTFCLRLLKSLINSNHK